MKDNTIAAISTARGTAGISVIRISGDSTVETAQRVFKAKSNKPLSSMRGYTCALGTAYADGEAVDECIASVFKAPHSYTGEDVVELSCHGGMYVTARILRAVYDAGAEPAGPGEFTKRAFLNGKLDLIEAESVMDIISARSRVAAKAALSVKEGSLSRRVDAVKASLLNKAAHLSAWADYPEEDIPEVESAELMSSLEQAAAELNAIIKGYDDGRVLRDGIDAAIIGKPNVGKSTLMNLLSGYDKSIVTSVAGTTRDIVEESVSLDGLLLNLSDTAGIRATEDEVEKIGVDKAKSRIDLSALVLCVFDASAPLSEEDRDIIESLGDTHAVAVMNKTDLPARIEYDEIEKCFDHVVRISAKKAEGTDVLIKVIKDICSCNELDSDGALIYNERQRGLAAKALDSVREALNALNAGLTYDAVTISIEEAADDLCELTGEKVTDEVVDRVFHTFCVGK